MTKTTIIALAITAAFIATALGASIAHVVTAHQALADIGAQMDAAEAQQEAEAAVEAAEAAKAQVEAEIAALQAVAEAAEAEAVVIAQPITAEWLDLHPFSDLNRPGFDGDSFYWFPIVPLVVS